MIQGIRKKLFKAAALTRNRLLGIIRLIHVIRLLDVIRLLQIIVKRPASYSTGTAKRPLQPHHAPCATLRSHTHLLQLPFTLNIAATDSKNYAEDVVIGEDRVDFTLLTSVSSLSSLICRFQKWQVRQLPPFTFSHHRRLFTGTVPISVHDDAEFSCKGISSLMTPGDRIVFEGQLHGGAEGSVVYYWVAIRKERDCEYFTVSKQLGGDVVRL